VLDDGARQVEEPRRNQALEFIRIIAAYGIVAFHDLAPLRDIAYSGLVVFLILSPFVDCAFNWDRRRPLQTLAKTLLIPWAFWFVAYGLLNMARGVSLIPHERNFVLGVLFGTSEHLWFLPSMFVFLALLNEMKGRVQPRLIYWFCALMVSLLLATATLWSPVSLRWSPPLGQWMQAMAALLGGVALGLSNRVTREEALAGGVLMLLCLLSSLAEVTLGIGLPYLLGAGLVVAALAVQKILPARFNVQSISSCMFGVYLTHMGWLAVFHRVSGRANYETVTLAFVAALAATWIIQRTIPSSRLVLGPAGQ
jgi:hypothetical protein